MQQFFVRTGKGTVLSDGSFTDVVETVSRSVRKHSGWESVRYKGKRYQLHGGVHVFWFICLDHPIKRKQNG